MICPGCQTNQPDDDFRHGNCICRLCVNERQRERMTRRRELGVPATMALRLLELADPFNRGITQ